MKPETMQAVVSVLRDVTHILQERVRPFLEEQGLGVTHLAAMQQIAARGTATHAEVSHALGMTPGAFTPIARRLEQKGFIKRRRDPADRRRVIIEVSEGARHWRQAHLAQARRYVGDLFDDLSDDEAQRLVSYLDRIRERGRKPSSAAPP